MCPEYRANVYVHVKSEQLDPQSIVLNNTIDRVSKDLYPQWKGITNVKQGKRFTFNVEAEDRQKAREKTKVIAEELFSNPNIEEYKIASLREIKTK